MKLLTRYIIGEIASYFFIGLVVLTFVIYVRPLSQLLALLVRHDLTSGQIAELFALPIPSILTLTLPMAVLLGTLMALVRMGSDGEVVAVGAAGLGWGQFIRPVLLFATAGLLLTGWMSLSLAPAAERKLNTMEVRLEATQARYAIKPRVFIEQFPKLLLYIHDIRGPREEWHGIFIAEAGVHGPLKVTLAKTGKLVTGPMGRQWTLHLNQGETHELDAQDPRRYSIISFGETDIPIKRPGNTAAGPLRPRMLTPAELIREARNPATRRGALVELNYRLALAFAALVLALAGISVGLSTSKGGKGAGLVMTLALVFIYYILMAAGKNLAEEGKVGPTLGLWTANFIFGASGILLLLDIPAARSARHALGAWIEKAIARARSLGALRRAVARNGVTQTERRAVRVFQIMDTYVLRSWLFYLTLLLILFAGVYMMFDFFQLLNPIMRNKIPVSELLKYYWFLTPQVLYLMLPLAVLMATLVTFGLLTRRNEVTAARALGISLYRLGAPVLMAAGLLSGGMYLLANNYLPETNQMQDAMRNQIKGNPPETSYHPGRQWIFGESNRIYSYRYFDRERDVFAGLSVFELAPRGFRVVRRIYAERAFWQQAVNGWILEDGWVRDIDHGKVTAYRTFAISLFPEITEPPSYFKTEIKPSEQMSAAALRRYILALRQSGVDVVSLWVAFYKKFAYPLIALVVALIGLPFAFSGGKRGALWGVGLSFGIAIAYWALSSVFDAMGKLGQLPPTIAAWSPDVLFGLAGLYLFLRVRT